MRAHLELMGWDEVKALCDEGWTVGAHTVSHARLAGCAGEALRREVLEPVATIRSRLARRSVTMAYPFGRRHDISEDARTLVRDCGYAACLSNFGGENYPPGDLMDVRRIDIGGDHADLGWKAQVHGCDLSHWGVRWDGWFEKPRSQPSESA